MFKNKFAQGLALAVLMILFVYPAYWLFQETGALVGMGAWGLMMILAILFGPKSDPYDKFRLLRPKR